MEGEIRLDRGAGSPPDDKQRRQPTGHIDQAVVDRRGAAGDKTLVIFIDEGIRHNQSQRDQEPAAVNCGTRRAAKSARGQESENRVLGEVCQLSSDEVNDG